MNVPWCSEPQRQVTYEETVNQREDISEMVLSGGLCAINKQVHVYSIVGPGNQLPATD